MDMNRIGGRVALCTLFLLATLVGSSLAVSDTQTVKVGLAYGSGALASANLENSVGSGYRFGYYTSSGTFVSLGSTSTTQISMLKTQNLYLAKDGTYTTFSSGSAGTIGCYHIQLPGTYSTFSDAQSKAATINGGFPAWVSGIYYVRTGAYATEAAAKAAQSNLGISGTAIVGTTSSGISVTQTKTTKILFQYDNAGGAVLAVKPGTSGEGSTKTWFKGNQYAGSFLYERIGGGNVTVINYVTMDDYLKGIIPYEMSSSWPAEALKAQAVCARSYVLSSTGSKHAANHFDLCNTTCCQAYRGCGRATDFTDAQVDATSGICAWYNGKIAQTFYYASNGGATEDCANIWFADLPYLKGKTDPYESDIANTVSGYYWTKTYTANELTTLLKNKGVSCGTIVDLAVTQFTPAGNVKEITFTDNTGKTYVYAKEKVRTILGLKSFHFTITGGSGGSSTTSYYVDGTGTLSSLDGVWAIGSGGGKEQVSGSGQTVITSSGKETLNETTQGTAVPTGSFVISGAGNGHNVGMSQWGAYAMAKRGYTYDQILKFYYTGIDLY